VSIQENLSNFNEFFVTDNLSSIGTSSDKHEIQSNSLWNIVFWFINWEKWNILEKNLVIQKLNPHFIVSQE
jgi:hypothetical protein